MIFDLLLKTSFFLPDPAILNATITGPGNTANLTFSTTDDSVGRALLIVVCPYVSIDLYGRHLDYSVMSS